MKQKAHDWGEHLIWMEGGEPLASEALAPARWPGLLLAFSLALLAWFLAGFSSLADPIFLGMILGMIGGNTVGHSSLTEGTSYAVRKILPLGIVLLGARLDFLQVVNLGGTALLMSLAVVAGGAAVVYGLRNFWRLERTFAILLAVGTAICGGTAIVAVAPLVKAKEREIIMGVAVVTLTGLAAMILLPALGNLLGLSQKQFGVVAGLTIHQTPQVVASGFAYGDLAGQTATIVKLARVCLLAPVALLLGWWTARGLSIKPVAVGKKPWWKYFPLFALGFLVMALIRTLGFFPDVKMTWDIPWLESGQSAAFDTAALLKSGSSFLLAAGMAAVGYQTRLSQFRNMGARPLLAAAGSSMIIAVAVILSVKFLIP